MPNNFDHLHTTPWYPVSKNDPNGFQVACSVVGNSTESILYSIYMVKRMWNLCYTVCMVYVRWEEWNLCYTVCMVYVWWEEWNLCCTVCIVYVRWVEYKICVIQSVLCMYSEKSVKSVLNTDTVSKFCALLSVMCVCGERSAKPVIQSALCPYSRKSLLSWDCLGGLVRCLTLYGQC